MKMTNYVHGVAEMGTLYFPLCVIFSLLRRKSEDLPENYSKMLLLFDMLWLEFMPL